MHADVKYDTELIDLGALDYRLKQADSLDASIFKTPVKALIETLKTRFLSGVPTSEIVQARSWAIDQVLLRLWEQCQLSLTQHALIAVGGYGRGELHPYSDIDIAILLSSSPNTNETKNLEIFVTALWDIGLEIGHSVRTVKQSVSEARDNVTVMTNLLESRLLAGSPALFTTLKKKLDHRRIWPSKKYYNAKVKEQQARHRKFDDAFQQLEPNLKDSPGGLRDIQIIAWIANRHFGSGTLDGLVANGFLTESEYAALMRGRDFLWRVRCALHFEAGRHEDRLSFEYQTRVAQLFGYTDEQNHRAVEKFMKQFYQTVRELSLLNEMLLGLFDEAINSPTSKAKLTPINRRFQLRNNYIETTSPQVIANNHQALMEVFLLLQQYPQVRGIHPGTIRQIIKKVKTLSPSFCTDIQVRSLFLEIIRQPHELQRMHRYGVLAAYLPEFARVAGQMQFDLFHIYTVDEHSLFVVRNMRRFSYPEGAGEQPALCLEVIKEIPKLEVLYIAGLFHDIAKGRGGEHSELGADDAVEFCRNHSMNVHDTHLIAWLVRNHLVMSATAQRKDIYDPKVVQDFAELVGDKIHLDYLYLLTVADIRGTNPELWNNWKDSLFSELYLATRRALDSHTDTGRETTERLTQTKKDALAMLLAANIDADQVHSLWQTFGDSYFLRHRPAEIAWHCEEILTPRSEDGPVVAVKNFSHRGGTAVFVYTDDIDNLFALTTATLDNLQLNIQNARIITASSGIALDTFMVIGYEGKPVTEADKMKRIKTKLQTAIQAGAAQKVSALNPNQRRIKSFRIPVNVEFQYDGTTKCTQMCVVATDHPGMLSKIGYALQKCNLRLHDARIATFGEKAEDFFYITDRDNKSIDDPARQQNLRDEIVTALSG